MTDPNPSQADLEPFLPGMASLEPAATPMERAARLQIASLRDRGMLTADHAIVVQLVLDLARAIGLSAGKGRASALAMAAKELREAVALLPGDGADDGFDELMKRLTAQPEQPGAGVPESSNSGEADRG